MTKRYLFLMLLTLILSVSVVSASQNVTDLQCNPSDDVVSHNGDLSGVLLENESSDVNSNNSENTQETTDLSKNENNTEFNINENTNKSNDTDATFILSGSDVKGYDSNNFKYNFKLRDNNGNPVAKADVTLKMGGKVYPVVTDKNGAGSLNLNLKAGTYKITATYNDASITNKIKVLTVKVTTKNLSVYYGTKAKYTVTVLDSEKNPVTGKNTKITIGKKVYTIKTNAKGVATLTLNYNSGNYKIKYVVDSITGTNTYKVKNKVTLKILYWGNKGDVSKVKLIKNSMPNNIWVKKAVAATKKGLPLLKFKGGSGKVIFITAGVHGNELSSQVAAMKLIKYMSDNPIKGTVYIIPFVNVKAISKKVRYTNVDYNRVAHKSGSISNKIVKLVSQYKCDAYGDFHTTQPGGIPGKNVVMGSKSPNLESYKLTNYIVKKCKVNKIVYNYAGQKYPGAIADNVNKKGIPAVLCEVMLPHNTITTKTVNLSLSMMKSLLKFNSVI